MKFELDEEELTKLKEWQDAIKKVFGEYGRYTYSFTPNGIGVEIEVYSDLAKTTLDLTNVDKW